MAKKIPVCGKCGDGAIEMTSKKVWNEIDGCWEEIVSQPIYDCPECGEVDIVWVGE